METRSGAGAGKARRQKHYEELLSRQEESGLSVRAFAQQAGLSVATLYSWRRRLRRAGGRDGRASRLVEVRVSEARAAAGETPQMVVSTSGGVRIELGANFDGDAFARALRILERC